MRNCVMVALAVAIGGCEAPGDPTPGAQSDMPEASEEIQIINGAFQVLKLVRVEYGGRVVEFRDIPEGGRVTRPAPPAWPGCAGPVRVTWWGADGAVRELGIGAELAVGRRPDWIWTFDPSGYAGGGPKPGAAPSGR